MWRADGVSFDESSPWLFAVGKTGLVVDAVQGALIDSPTAEFSNSHVTLMRWHVRARFSTRVF